jgi:hypothetical protein
MFGRTEQVRPIISAEVHSVSCTHKRTTRFETRRPVVRSRWYPLDRGLAGVSVGRRTSPRGKKAKHSSKMAINRPRSPQLRFLGREASRIASCEVGEGIGPPPSNCGDRKYREWNKTPLGPVQLKQCGGGPTGGGGLLLHPASGPRGLGFHSMIKEGWQAGLLGSAASGVPVRSGSAKSEPPWPPLADPGCCIGS